MDAVNHSGTRPRGRGQGATHNDHGQAALLLAESLMHALVANGTMTREDFVDVVDGAADVERALARENALPPSDCDGSLLYPLASAFRRELGR